MAVATLAPGQTRMIRRANPASNRRSLMQTPLQITFRNIDASPDVEAKVRERVMELEQFSSRRAIETTISSRCHRSCGSGRPRLRFRATIGPNFSTHRRTVSLLISNPRSANRIFDVAVTQGETTDRAKPPAGSHLVGSDGGPRRLSASHKVAPLGPWQEIDVSMPSGAVMRVPPRWPQDGPGSSGTG